MIRNPLKTKGTAQARASRALLFDPEGEESLREVIEPVFSSLTESGKVAEALEICSDPERAPGVIVFVERGEQEGEIRRLLEQLEAMQGHWELLYLYGDRPLYASRFARYAPSFHSWKDPELLQPTLQNLLYAHLYKEGLRQARRRVKSLEKKLGEVGESYRQEKEEARRAMELRETWFASMVHELRTPVNGILGLAHLLSQSDLDEEQRQRLKKIESSGDILLGLVNDLLDFAKIESGKMELEEIEFDLNEVLERVAAAVGFQAEAKGLRLIFEIEKEVPARIVGDPLRVSQILINLLNNAVKFTQQGEVLLRISMPRMEGEHGTLLFEVIDTGIGMDEKQRRRLFGSFAQADRSVSRKYGGTGLGLMISKELVEKMNGRIGVESRPGKGSRFHFTLPTRRTERRSYRLPSKELMNKRVLILDESAPSAKALGKMFQYFHYRTDHARSREELATALERNSYDLVIVDESLAPLCDGECRRKGRGAFFVALRSDYTEGKIPASEYDAVLKRPLTQQKVFRLILGLYHQEGSQQEENSIDEIRRRLASRKGSRILVADDNAINQAVILGLLSKIDFEGILAGDGVEVLEQLEHSEGVDLILMDLHMPRMRGDEAARRIHENPKYADLPIVALSADRIQKEMLGEMGMQDSLSKPIDVARFYEVLERWIPEKEGSSGHRYYLEPHGFDVSEGLERAGGNHPLYCQLLENFLLMAQQSCRELSKKHLMGDRSEATRLLELIISGASNMRARSVHDQAVALLESLSGADLGVSRQRCRELEEFLELSLERIGEAKLLQRIEAKREAGKKEGSRKLYFQTLEELLEAVRERRLYHCDRMLRALEDHWWSPAREKRIDDLRRLFDESRYGEMETVLRKGLAES